MTDLELLSAEATPRSAATCARLVGRVASIAGILWYGVLWFFVASMVSTPLLLVGIAIVGDHGSRAAGYAVVAVWLGSFVVAWVPFGVWMARRRARARSLIRDGRLIDATLEHGRNASGQPTGASIRFSSADGSEHRALFALDAVGATPGSSHRALFAPDADHCLVFSGAGKAIPAALVRDIAIVRGDGRTTVMLRRGRTEKIVTGILVVMLLESLYGGIVLTWLQRPDELRCDRATDTCTMSGTDIMFSHWSWSFRASQMKRSAVRKKHNGDVVWELWMSDGSSRGMGGIAGGKSQRAQYQRESDALAAFIATPDQPKFESRFLGMTSDSLPVWILILAALGYPLARLIHGWRTTLTFDGAAGELTIERSPALLSPAKRTFTLSSVARVEAVRSLVWIGFVTMSMSILRLVGGDGKLLFRRRLTIDADLAPEVAAMREALGPR